MNEKNSSFQAGGSIIQYIVTFQFLVTPYDLETTKRKLNRGFETAYSQRKAPSKPC